MTDTSTGGRAAVRPTAITVGSDTQAAGPAVERPLLTPVAAAERLAVAPATLERWRVRRQGPAFVKLGRLVRYRVADLDAFVQASLASKG